MPSLESEFGAGPFTMHTAGRTYRFEDSDRFGPVFVTQKGENQLLPEEDPFWDAHRKWVAAGRKVREGVCVT